MQEAFNAQSKTIGDMLNGQEPKRLVVPEFQRGYSWEKKHVESFWKDIVEFQMEKAKAGGPEKYFLGPIVTLTDKPKIVEILDGQQRLATATILFSVLRDAGRALNIKGGQDFAAYVQRDFIAKEEDGYCLQMGQTDEVYFRETIQEDREVPSEIKPTLKSHHNILKAKVFLSSAIKSKIDSMDQPSAVTFLKGMKNVLRSDLVMACIPVGSERDAFRIFETLNDRGLRLSVPDLLLNYLMRVADPEGDRPQIKKTWNEMILEMGKKEINRFLRHLWISKYGDLKNQDLFSALKKHIEDKSLNSLVFAQSFSGECTDYMALLNADKERISSDALPVIRSLLQDLDIQSALPMLLSSYRVFDKPNFEKVARWVLVFATRHSVLANKDSSDSENTLFKMAKEIRSKMEKTKDSSPNPNSCLAYIKETLRSSSPSDEQIKAAMKDLILSPDEAKYVLAKIARAMQTKTKEVGPDEANLEHIYPVNPAPDSWGGKENQEKLDPYLWHIGNLTMLGKRINKTAANKEYSIKRKEYESKSELAMAQELAAKYATWDVAAIESRAQNFTQIVLDIWDFDNPSMV